MRTDAGDAVADIFDRATFRAIRERILDVLARHMSATNAQATLNRAERSCGVERELEAGALPALFAAIERCAIPLVDRRIVALLRGELEFELSMAGGKPHAATLLKQSFVVRNEWDVSAARTRSRELVTALGGTSYDAVRAMTLVSELGRNILLYTPGGQIDFIPSESPRSVLVIATDQGAGIPNLDEIFSGRFRSRTGLGKGLIGAKRLARRFEIQTGPGGTCIEAEVLL